MPNTTHLKPSGYPAGLPAWSINYGQYNRIQSSLTGGAKTSPEIYLESMSTNEYLFVAERNLLSIYVNRESLGSVTINRLSDGYVTYYIRQESGNTTCIFDNAWIWDLTEKIFAGNWIHYPSIGPTIMLSWARLFFCISLLSGDIFWRDFIRPALPGDPPGFRK
jgi:hypothetical protein